MKLQKPDRKQKVDTEIYQARALNDKVRVINETNEAYESLKTAVKEKETQLLREHSELVGSINADLEVKRRELATLFEPLEEKERKLVTLEAYLEDKEIALKKEDIRIQSRQIEIESREAHLRLEVTHVNAQLQELNNLSTQYAQERANIIEMERTAKNMLRDKQDELDKKESELRIVERKVKEEIARIQAKEEVIDAKMKELETERTRINKLKARYER